MKSKEELFNMTVLELKEYVNSLSNPEIKEVAETAKKDLSVEESTEIVLNNFGTDENGGCRRSGREPETGV